MAAVSILIIGAGDRGTAYSTYAKHRPDLVSIAGVADRRPHYREHVARVYDVPSNRVYSDWREALGSENRRRGHRRHERS